MSPIASGFTLGGINGQMGNGISQLESQLQQSLTDLQNNPQPSMQQLTEFQMQMSLWTNMVQMESSITKVYGDTMKQVVMNIGS